MEEKMEQLEDLVAKLYGLLFGCAMDNKRIMEKAEEYYNDAMEIIEEINKY